MMHTAMVIEHRIERRVTLDQNEAGASRIEEHHLPVRRGGQMPAADDLRIELRAGRDVANRNTEMGNSPDLGHLILPCANTRLTLIGYAPIRGHNTPQKGIDISAAPTSPR